MNGKLKDVTKDELELLINEKLSYDSIGSRYNVTGSAIRRKAQKLGIVLPKRRRINEKEKFNKGRIIRTDVIYCLNGCGKPVKKGYKFCSQSCCSEYNKNEKIKKWLSGEFEYKSEHTPTFIKNYLMKIHNNSCEICGWNEVNKYTGNVPLELHHIDGDCTNNNISNLQLLCPNHHSLTNTMGSLNRGKSKRYKLKKYKKKLNNP